VELCHAPNVVYPWYPLRRGGHIHETQLADNRALAFTFADADDTLVAIPEEVVRVLERETLPDSGQLHERINTAARIAADQR
jgi:hypothetical protein